MFGVAHNPDDAIFGHWPGRLGELANRCEPFVHIVMDYVAWIK